MNVTIERACFIFTSIDHLPANGNVWYTEYWDGRLELIPEVMVTVPGGDGLAPDPQPVRHHFAIALPLANTDESPNIVIKQTQRYAKIFDAEIDARIPAQKTTRDALRAFTTYGMITKLASLQRVGLEWLDYMFTFTSSTSLEAFPYALVSSQTVMCLDQQDDAPRFRYQYIPVTRSRTSPTVEYLGTPPTFSPPPSDSVNSSVFLNVVVGDPLDVAHRIALRGVDVTLIVGSEHLGCGGKHRTASRGLEEEMWRRTTAPRLGHQYSSMTHEATPWPLLDDSVAGIGMTVTVVRSNLATGYVFLPESDRANIYIWTTSIPPAHKLRVANRDSAAATIVNREEHGIEVGSREELCILFLDQRTGHPPPTEACTVACKKLESMGHGRFLIVLPKTVPCLETNDREDITEAVMTTNSIDRDYSLIDLMEDIPPNKKLKGCLAEQHKIKVEGDEINDLADFGTDHGDDDDEGNGQTPDPESRAKGVWNPKEDNSNIKCVKEDVDRFFFTLLKRVERNVLQLPPPAKASRSLDVMG